MIVTVRISIDCMRCHPDRLQNCLAQTNHFAVLTVGFVKSIRFLFFVFLCSQSTCAQTQFVMATRVSVSIMPSPSPTLSSPTPFTPSPCSSFAFTPSNGAIYRLYFSPIAKFPRPRSTAQSFRYMWKIGEYHEIHGKYRDVLCGSLAKGEGEGGNAWC